VRQLLHELLHAPLKYDCVNPRRGQRKNGGVSNAAVDSSSGHQSADFSRHYAIPELELAICA
jgi:hypothetical protein